MPMALAGSADAAGCDLVWVIDSSAVRSEWFLVLVRRLGMTIDIAGMSDDEAADALRPCQPDGIISYADSLIPTASALAARLGLEYHDAATAARLTDKFSQRQALLDGGLPVPRFVVVPSNPTPHDVEALVAGVDFPVVVKPRRGAASRNTSLVRDAAELQVLLADLGMSDCASEPSIVIEEYFPGASPPPSPHFADYVTVESVVAAGQISHVAVAGRFPPAEPFRESGFFIPSDFSTSDTKDVLAVATMAVSALGIRTGFLNTEIKMTPSGPRVIEVNGRLGGSAPAMMAQAAGVDLVELSQRVALGEHVVFDGLVPTDRVGCLFYVQAPQWASKVMSVEGLDRLRAHPGVDTVFLNRQPGDEVDWRKGSQEFVFSVLGAAPDHEGVLEMKGFIDEEVTIAYSA
jgi:biotin carboxylase